MLKNDVQGQSSADSLPGKALHGGYVSSTPPRARTVPPAELPRCLPTHQEAGLHTTAPAGLRGQRCGCSDNRSQWVSVLPTRPAGTNTSYPATCSSYRTVGTLQPALRIFCNRTFTTNCNQMPLQRTGKTANAAGTHWSLLPRTSRWLSSELRDLLSYNYTILNLDLPVTFCKARISLRRISSIHQVC